MSEGVTSVTIGSHVVGHCMVACQRCGNCQRERRHLCRNLKEVLRASGTERFGMPEDGIDKTTDLSLANPYRNPRGQKRDAVCQGRNTEKNQVTLLMRSRFIKLVERVPDMFHLKIGFNISRTLYTCDVVSYLEFAITVFKSMPSIVHSLKSAMKWLVSVLYAFKLII